MRAVEYLDVLGPELWHTPTGEPYADVVLEGARLTLPVRGRQMRDLLARLVYDAETAALAAQARQEAVDVLAARAVHAGDEHRVHVRVAEHQGRIYLDLGDASWRAVEIDGTGWRIVDRPPVRFRRGRAMLPLPEPVPPGNFDDGNLDELRDVVRLTDEHFLLLVAWLLGTLKPGGPYPILGLTGEHGTGKTTLARMLRSLVDPSTAPVRTLPRDDQALMVAAQHSHIIALDNVSGLPLWLSDALCRLSTGGGYAARELYTDHDEVVLDAVRPVILTGIADVATRADLADRTITIELPRLEDRDRRREADIWRRFRAAVPSILGNLLNMAATGTAREAHVELPELPRMADWATWVHACETACPWEPGGFLAAYSGARNEMVTTAIEADPVALAVLELVAAGDWSGTAEELRVELDHRHDGRKPPRDWPTSARALSGRITRVAPLLRADGVVVERVPHPSGGRRRLLRISRQTKGADDVMNVTTSRRDVCDVRDVSAGLSLALDPLAILRGEG